MFAGNPPGIIYGTAWKYEKTRALIDLALACGFAAFDTANQQRYYDEVSTGAALHPVRDRIFLQTKFTYADGHGRLVPYDRDVSFSTQVEQSFALSLKNLQTDYVDSYLLHGPSSARGMRPPDWEVWRKMESLFKTRKALRIGVSNISLRHLVELRQHAEVPPSIVQNRCLASENWDRDVRLFCREHSIAYQAFSLLTNKPPLEHIARRAGKTVEQVLYRFAIQSGMIPITGTATEEHMREALSCLDFELAPEDAAQIEDPGNCVK